MTTAETIEIRKHEREAIQQLIANARGLASVIEDADRPFVHKLLAAANIAEELLDRAEPL